MKFINLELRNRCFVVWFFLRGFGGLVFFFLPSVHFSQNMRKLHLVLLPNLAQAQPPSTGNQQAQYIWNLQFGTKVFQLQLSTKGYQDIHGFRSLTHLA